MRGILHCGQSEASSAATVRPTSTISLQHFTAGGDTFKAFKYKVLSLDAFAGMCYELMPILTDGSTR